LEGNVLSLPDGLALPGGVALPGGLAGCGPAATHFLLLRQKKVSKEKATPLSATRSFAAGNLSCDGLAGNRSNSLRSDNRGSFSRQTATTQAHTEGVGGRLLVALCATLRCKGTHTNALNSTSDFICTDSKNDSFSASEGDCICNARRSRASSAAPCAVVRRRVAQGWADQGSRLSEATAEFERDPAQTEQHSVPEALLRDDAFGSPFFWVLFFGEAKKSASPAGARPGQRAPHKTYTSTTSTATRPSGQDPTPVREGTTPC